jgi:hypothetical protein
MFRRIFVDKIDCLTHTRSEHNATCPFGGFKDGSTKGLSPFWQRRHFPWKQGDNGFSQGPAIRH